MKECFISIVRRRLGVKERRMEGIIPEGLKAIAFAAIRKLSGMARYAPGNFLGVSTVSITGFI